MGAACGRPPVITLIREDEGGLYSVPPGKDQDKGEVVVVETLRSLAQALLEGILVPLVWVHLYVYLDNARYRGGSLFSTEIVKNRSPRSSCSAPASSSATRTRSILYLPSLTSALFTPMSRGARA